jgi:dynein heavy chain
VAQISKAAHGLLKFVEMVVAYCGIYREVKPKRDRVAQMERDFEQVRCYCKPPDWDE